ncbi:MAG TPA: sulfite exporter TauE/SafE family protein [Rectinemataceae bacterium]|nr:sulfite exporter TauE/SafE family protein [Rectinemataceae bacterium]
MVLDALHLMLVALAALAAGFVNAIAGGGTLITFPALVFLGLSPVSANVTSTVALCPGYFGATWAQRSLLVGEGPRLGRLMPSALLGGLIGALLLLRGGERTFTFLVPYLILAASALLAIQTPVKRGLERLSRRGGQDPAQFDTGGLQGRAGMGAILGVGCAAIYGGYFGAGVSVVILAVLGIAMADSLTRLNALKQAIALSANVAAATLFAFSGRVQWLVAVLMALAALGGGMLGGKLGGRISPAILRVTVVALGFALGLYYLVGRS